MLPPTEPDYFGIGLMIVYGCALTAFVVDGILSWGTGLYKRLKRNADESNEEVNYNLPKSDPCRGL